MKKIIILLLGVILLFTSCEEEKRVIDLGDARIENNLLYYKGENKPFSGIVKFKKDGNMIAFPNKEVSDFLIKEALTSSTQFFNILNMSKELDELKKC